MALKKPDLDKFWKIIKRGRKDVIVNPPKVKTLLVDEDVHVMLKVYFASKGVPVAINVSTIIRFMFEYGLMDKVFELYPLIGWNNIVRWPKQKEVKEPVLSDNNEES